MSELQWKMDSKIGPLYLVASSTGLKGIFWKKQDVPMTDSLGRNKGAEEVRLLAKAVHQLEEYLGGKRKSFDLPLDAAGTEFQQRVWKELEKIPYGETRSYADVARTLKNGKASRAVGAANGKNPLSIIVPCHRVIAADGSLGGYAGGLEIKSKLLELERTERDRYSL